MICKFYRYLLNIKHMHQCGGIEMNKCVNWERICCAIGAWMCAEAPDEQVDNLKEKYIINAGFFYHLWIRSTHALMICRIQKLMLCSSKEKSFKQELFGLQISLFKLSCQVFCDPTPTHGCAFLFYYLCSNTISVMHSHIFLPAFRPASGSCSINAFSLNLEYTFV